MFIHISYTIPPLKKNYKAQIIANSEEQAIAQLLRLKPDAKITKIIK